MTLLRAISKVGGFNNIADTGHVTLRRKVKEGIKSVHVDVQAIIDNKIPGRAPASWRRGERGPARVLGTNAFAPEALKAGRGPGPRAEAAGSVPKARAAPYPLRRPLRARSGSAAMKRNLGTCQG